MTRKVRFYSHCGKIKGSIVIFGMNMVIIKAKILVLVFSPNISLAAQENATSRTKLDVAFGSLCSFIFTPESSDEAGLKGRNIYLNGKRLEFVA